MTKKKDKRATSDKAEESIKATFYIRIKTAERLEQEWLRRRVKGEKISKSQMINDAINKLLDD